MRSRISSSGFKTLTVMGIMMAGIVGTAKEATAQALAMTQPVTSTLDPLRKQSDFVFHAAPGDSIMQVTNTSTVPNAEIINRFIDPSGQFYSGTFHFNPNDPNPDGTTGTGDELLSVGGGYAVNMQARGNKLLIESDGTMVYNPLAPVQIVGLPTLSTITGEPIECQQDSSSDGYDLDLSLVGAGTPFGSGTTVISQNGIPLYSGPLTTPVEVVSNSNSDLIMASVPGSDGYMATLDSLPLTDTISGVPARPDHVAEFMDQDYDIIANDSLSMTVRFNNATSDTIYYMVSPALSQAIRVLPEDSVTHVFTKTHQAQLNTVLSCDREGFGKNKECYDEENNLLIPAIETIPIGIYKPVYSESTDDYVVSYPNPTKGKVELQINHEKIHKIESLTIMNALGENILQVHEQEHIKDFITDGIDLSDYPDGTYFIQFKSTIGAVKKTTTLNITKAE